MFTSPTVAHTVIIAVLLVIISFFGLAISIELWRRRSTRLRVISYAWSAARAHAAQQGLSGEQWAVLRDMLRRHAPEHPYPAMTDVIVFDRCVRREFERIGAATVKQRDVLGENLREIRTLLGLSVIPAGVQWQSTLMIEEGLTINVKPVGDEKASWREFFIRRVNDAHFFLTPRDPRHIKGVIPGDRFRMFLWHADDARYEFVASVAQVDADPAGLVFAHSHTMKRIQSRAHFRIAYTAETRVELYSVPEKEMHNPLPWIYQQKPLNTLPGTFTNLSAGGFAILLPQAPPPHAFLNVTVFLENQHPSFEAIGSVVGTVLLSDHRCLVRAAFQGLTQDQEEAISQYVFLRQRRDQRLQTARENEEQGVV